MEAGRLGECMEMWREHSVYLYSEEGLEAGSMYVWRQDAWWWRARCMVGAMVQDEVEGEGTAPVTDVWQ